MAGAVLWSSFAALLAVVTVSDLRTRRIPDRVVIAAAAIVVLTLAVSAPAALGGRLLAASAAGAFLLAAAVANPAGMGLGDVKLAVVLGLYLGRAVAPALLIAFATGALCGAVLIAVRGWPSRHEAIPFAPFLATGAAVARVTADNVDPWN